jgi:23S rRNA pseudouridine2605 synthase
MDRLHKVLAHAGVASRRKAEELIVKRRVRVNGKIVAELGTQVDPARDRIEVDGRPVRAESKTYIILHKPRGYLSDRDEKQTKPTALDLVPSPERLYAAGQLDANSEGLLLLTNDGELAHRVTHPRFEHAKEYLALVQGLPDDATLAQLKKGIWYEGDLLRADSAKIVRQLGAVGRRQHWPEAGPNECWLRIVLHEGKKREVRHMAGAVGHPVKRLIRVRVGPLALGTLPVGQWRQLDEREVDELRTTLRKR